MTILLQINTFPSILKKLPLNELIILRRVCHEWKAWIDGHLKQQTILLVADKRDYRTPYKQLTSVSQTLDINASKIFLNKLEIEPYNLYRKWKKPVVLSLLRMFPNIEELYIFFEQKDSFYKNLNYEILLWGWKGTLRKLIIPDLYGDYSSRIVRCLNKCSKLETLGLYENDTDDKYGSGNHRYIEGDNNNLDQLTSFWVPVEDWNHYRRYVINVPGIAGPTIDSNNLPDDRFLNTQRIYQSIDFFSERVNNLLCKGLKKFAEWKHKKLCCLEFTLRCFCMGWLDDPFIQDRIPWVKEVFKESKYPPFSADMNRFQSVETLKFELEHPSVLRYVLNNSANFDYVETLIINYKYVDHRKYFSRDTGVLQFPSNFVELLPKSVNRIQNLEFHLESQNCDGFKRTDFSEFPNKVKIFHDL